MHQETKFSIALPVYNGGPHLKQCIQSILNQTYPNFKLLVFNSVNNNDGSTEFINGVVDKRVRIIQATDILNIEQNWARFIHEFDTEFATIIGQDDILSPDFLEKMNELILKYPDASLWHSHFTFIDKDGKTIRKCEPLPVIESPDDYLKNILSAKSDSIGTGYIFRSKDYINVDGIPLYPSLLFADLALWIKLTHLSYKVNSQEHLFFFRIHDSTTSLSSPITYFNSFLLFIKFLNSLSILNDKYNQTLKKYLSDYLVYCTEVMSFRIIRAEKPTMINEKKFTVKYMLGSINEFVTKEKIIDGEEKLNFTMKTKIASIINSSLFLQKFYQFLKTTRF